MYTNVLMLLSRTLQAILMYDNFENYTSGFKGGCVLNSGYSLFAGNLSFYGRTTGCLRLFKEIFYDSFESDAPGSRQYESLFGSHHDVGYYNSQQMTGSGNNLSNLGSLAGSGTNVSGVYTDGYYKSGYYFNSGYIIYPHNPLFNLNDFTIEFRMKRDGWLGGYSRLIDKNYIDGFSVSRADVSDSINFNIGGANHFSNGTIPDNVWTHVACVRSGAEGKIYLNGVIDDTFILPSTQLTSSDPFAIAQNRSTLTGQESFRGYLDEIRLWNYARASGSIYYYNDKNLDTIEIVSNTGLLIYFPFEPARPSHGKVFLIQDYLYDSFAEYPSGSGTPILYNSGVFVTNYLSYSGVVTGSTYAII